MQTITNNILIIDDDRDLCELLTDYLSGEGYETDCAYDGAEGLSKAIKSVYALIILDVMLPVQDGLNVLRSLRTNSKTLNQPVIMLTAKGEETDRVVGLELGADDYLQKPFSPRELLARIRAILRRANPTFMLPTQTDEAALQVDDIEIWPASLKTHVNGQEIILSVLEFRLLEKLLESAGKVLEREHLYKAILGHYSNPFERSLDMHISRLRKKLGPRQNGGERIRAVRGEGYMFLKS